MFHDARRLLVALPVILLAVAIVAGIRVSAASAEPVAPAFGDPFWKHWGDGQAELAGYDLTYPRYGEQRSGIAVTIFVTETFSDRLRVKADPGNHPEADQYPVIKLNLAQHFPTGIYPYSLMTSSFVAVTPRHGHPAGSATKVSFSMQEWCGHVYHQVLFDANQVRSTSHSYFDGEADEERHIALSASAVAEDALLHWARGMAWPIVKPGDSVTVPLLESMELGRTRHRPIAMREVTLEAEAEPRMVEVPAGSFEVIRRTAKTPDGTWTFDVESAHPHRIIRWSHTDGREAKLIKSDRMKYWRMNANRFVSSLDRIGLKPRGERMP